MQLLSSVCLGVCGVDPNLKDTAETAERYSENKLSTLKLYTFIPWTYSTPSTFFELRTVFLSGLEFLSPYEQVLNANLSLQTKCQDMGHEQILSEIFTAKNCYK